MRHAGSVENRSDIRLACFERKGVAFDEFVVLDIFTALCADRIHLFRSLFAVPQADKRLPLADDFFKAVEHLKFFDHWRVHHDLAAHAIERQPALKHQRHVVAFADCQSADHARPGDRQVEQTPLVVEIFLFKLKIPHRQQLPIKITVAFNRKQTQICHGHPLQSWYHTGWPRSHRSRPAHIRRSRS